MVKHLPVPKINIIPEGQYKKTGMGKVKPITYKKSKEENVALLIQDKIKEYLERDSFSIERKASDVVKKETDNTKLSLQGLFLKANGIKNESTNLLKGIKDLDSKDPMFKSLNMQKAVLDKLINSYLEKINGLRVREGRYTKADENERSLLPNKLTSIELEYTKLKDLFEAYKKEYDISPDEKNKRTAKNTYEKLIEMNKVLDPKTNEKKLSDLSIQQGEIIDNMIRELNEEGVRDNVINQFEEMFEEFKIKVNESLKKLGVFTEALGEEAKRAPNRGISGERESYFTLAEISNMERLVDSLSMKIQKIFIEQTNLLNNFKDYSKQVLSSDIIKYTINQEIVNNMDKEIEKIVDTINKKVKKVEKVEKIDYKTYTNISVIYETSVQLLQQLEQMRRYVARRKVYPFPLFSTTTQKDENGYEYYEIDIIAINNKPLIKGMVSNAMGGHYYEPLRNLLEFIDKLIWVFKGYKDGYANAYRLYITLDELMFPLPNIIESLNNFSSNEVKETFTDVNILYNLFMEVIHPMVYNNVNEKTYEDEYVDKIEQITNDKIFIDRLYLNDKGEVILNPTRDLPKKWRRRGVGRSNLKYVIKEFQFPDPNIIDLSEIKGDEDILKQTYDSYYNELKDESKTQIEKSEISENMNEIENELNKIGIISLLKPIDIEKEVLREKILQSPVKKKEEIEKSGIRRNPSRAAKKELPKEMLQAPPKAQIQVQAPPKAQIQVQAPPKTQAQLQTQEYTPEVWLKSSKKKTARTPKKAPKKAPKKTSGRYHVLNK